MKLRFFGCGGRDFFYGHNSAFFVEKNQKNNSMFLIDLSTKSASVARQSGILRKEKIDQLFVHFTHFDADHINNKGAQFIARQGQLNRVEYLFLKTGIKDHDNAVIDTFYKLTSICKKKLGFISLRELAYNMGLADVEIEPVPHHRKMNNNPQMCMAVIMQDKEGQKTVYATDHCDADFIGRKILDDSVVQIYTDATDLPANRAHSHLSLEELCDVVKPSLRSKVTVMHAPKDLPPLAMANGFKCANDLLISKEQRYSHINNIQLI